VPLEPEARGGTAFTLPAVPDAPCFSFPSGDSTAARCFVTGGTHLASVTPPVPAGRSGPLGWYRARLAREPAGAARAATSPVLGGAIQPAFPTTTEDTSAVRTYSPKPGDITRAWHVIDATDVVLGRLATQTAILLRGKHKPQYAPHVDVGDFVVIVNAGKIALTGQKRENKVAYRHSGHPGGLKTINVGDQLRTHPDRVVERAIKGMLPHNSLGRQMLSKLKIYAGPEHPHSAQQPQTFEIKQVAQ
jgi:large subunit ribosomal protein L13